MRMYKCSICGKEYNSVKDRAECEINCIHEAEEESKRLAKAEAEASRIKLQKEIEEDLESLKAKMKTYNDKYGFTYCFSTDMHAQSLGGLLGELLSW